MPVFDYKFTVDAPATAVSNFHHDTRILKKLSPPPIFVQIHRFEPLGEGSKAEFTLWFGPLPLRLPKDAAPPEKVAKRILAAYEEGHSGQLDLV